MKATLFICAGLAAGLALGAAHGPDLSKVDISKLPPAAAQTGLNYVKDVKPVLQQTCGKCHGPEKPKAHFRVDSREALLKGGESKRAAVTPGQSAKSPVILFASDLVDEMEMPPKGKRDKFPPLTREQIGLLRAWIDQGAK
jgi:mono/diheme cytochrome c family protein